MRNVFQKWKKRADVVRRRDGVSMAIVICIGALLLAFSLAMAYTGSLMMASANTRLEEERAYQLAKSFAEVLDEELNDQESDFYEFAYNFIGSTVYRDYDEDDTDKTVYTYSLDASSGLSENYGSVTVKLYKESTGDEDTETVLAGGSSTSGQVYDAYVDKIGEQEKMARNRYDLVVVVVAAYGDSEYAYKTEYKCEEQLRLQLTYTDSSGNSQKLYYPYVTTDSYTAYYIYEDQAYTSPYKQSYNIYYTLRTDSDGVISRTFVPAASENGTGTATGEE